MRRPDKFQARLDRDPQFAIRPTVKGGATANQGRNLKIAAGIFLLTVAILSGIFYWDSATKKKSHEALVSRCIDEAPEVATIMTQYHTNSVEIFMGRKPETYILQAAFEMFEQKLQSGPYNSSEWSSRLVGNRCESAASALERGTLWWDKDVQSATPEAQTPNAPTPSALVTSSQPAPAADPGYGAASSSSERTSVGGGETSRCMSELTGLLQQVAGHRMSQDQAESRIPDAAGTVAFRNAVSAVAAYGQEGIPVPDAITQASDAFSHVCGES